MALKRMVVELGMGTDLRGSDYTKTAIRALKDALWRNSLTIAPALGKAPEDMHVKVLVGVPKPELVDRAAVAEALPYGTREIEVVEGGLEIMNDEGTNLTVIANAAAVVYLDLENA
ncbi:Lin0512 family protein [Aestuariivirga sp.]|uniref:Lin0512 family protein n=1 Tax=Aestuariivirga sp. TaxID=2650926 RepID=UPI0025BAE09D|nr:Lin0512 family protein [Aestuariivirga sp.]MCA3555796.1 Lin0512 family protein [Aestuariivirga sp.]